MANGRWKDYLRNILHGQESGVLSLSVGLVPSDRAILIFDWGLAKDTLTLGLKLRFNFFSDLPHHLLGMASHNAHDAQAAAAECIKLWDSQRIAGALIAGQHPLAVKLLATRPLRTMVERVSKGEAITLMPELSDIVLPWRFFSIMERSIESKHSIGKKRLAPKQTLTDTLVDMTLVVPVEPRIALISTGGSVLAQFLAAGPQKLPRDFTASIL